MTQITSGEKWRWFLNEVDHPDLRSLNLHPLNTMLGLLVRVLFTLKIYAKYMFLNTVSNYLLSNVHTYWPHFTLKVFSFSEKK